MVKAPQADAIVLFGGAGDLALRMLFPSLYFLDADGFLPDGLDRKSTRLNSSHVVPSSAVFCLKTKT